MPDADAHVPLREDDPVGADALEDAAVRLRHRLRHDPPDAEVGEHRGREDARLDRPCRWRRRPSRTRRRRAGACARLVRRVGLDDVREDAGELLDGLRVDVDAEHLVAHADEGLRETAAEAAEPDDDELSVAMR